MFIISFEISLISNCQRVKLSFMNPLDTSLAISFSNFDLSYSISGINSIGIYDYINSDYTDKLSSWSEPGFYDKLFGVRMFY